MIRLSSMGAAHVVSSPSRDEQRMISLAQQGDRAAFDTLVLSYQSEIRKFLTKRVSSEQVDDLLQDIWLAAWLALPDFDQRSRLRTWLFGIAINKCKAHYRSSLRRLSQVPLDDLLTDPSLAVVSTSPLEDQMPALLERLSETHRQLLDLYYYGELTLPEISRLLDRNLNTVKYQFYRAHTEMANLLKEVRE